MFSGENVIGMQSAWLHRVTFGCKGAFGYAVDAFCCTGDTFTLGCLAILKTCLADALLFIALPVPMLSQVYFDPPDMSFSDMLIAFSVKNEKMVF